MRKKPLFILALAAVCAVLLYFEFRHDDLTEAFSYAPKEGQCFAAAGDALARLSNTTLEVYGLDGECLLKLQTDMISPKLSSDGEYCLLWDGDGRAWLRISADGSTWRGQCENRLICAEESGGRTILCTESDSCLAEVTLLDESLSPVLRCRLSDIMPSMLALSPDGKLLAIGGEGKLILVSADLGDELLNTELEAKKMQWISDEVLCLVGESAVYITDKNGDTKEYAANGIISRCAFGDGCVAIFVGRHKSGGGGEILCLSSSLEILGRADCEMPIAMELSDRGLLALERNRAVLYGRDMRIKDTVEVNSALYALFVGDDALIIDKSHIYMW